MNVFAKFDEIPSMILQDIKDTKRYGHKDGRLFVRTDNVKTVYPPANFTFPQTKFAGGIMTLIHQIVLKIYSKPEDQWSCKRSPDYFPGITTTVKREKGATSIF